MESISRGTVKRLLVLATKHVDRSHQDWEEIKKLALEVDGFIYPTRAHLNKCDYVACPHYGNFAEDLSKCDGCGFPKKKQKEDGECEHIWVSNFGKGGKPSFKDNGQWGTTPTVHVKCPLCEARTWFTEEQWNGLPSKQKNEFIQPVNPPVCKHGRAIGYGCEECGTGKPVA